MGFILDGLDTESYDRNYSDKDLLKRIIDYFRPHGRKMVGVAVLILLNSATSTAGPIIVGRGIDQVAQDATTRLIDQ